MNIPARIRRLRQWLGVFCFDWSRYREYILDDGHKWIQICNRNERLEAGPDGLGAMCLWQWSTPLHAPSMMPSLGRQLMQRALLDYPITMRPRPTDRGADAVPEVSFIIGHRGTERLPNLLATLDSIAAQEGPAFECLVVEQADVPEIPDHLPSWVQYHFCQSQTKGALYNRSLAFNVGARNAKGKLLVVHDNDMPVPTCYAKEMVARWNAGAKVINLKRFIFYLNERDSKAIMESRRICRGLIPDMVLQNLTGGGSLGVDSDWYFAVGGHDEGFVGWGGEDVEFWDRATSEGGLYGYAMMPIVHLWHRPQPDKTGQKDSNAMRRLEAVSQLPVAQRIENLRANQFPDIG